MFQNIYIYNYYFKPSVVAFTKGTPESLIPLGTSLKHKTEKNSMEPDLSAIGYYSERKVCDDAGLVTNEIFNYKKSGFTYRDIIDNKPYNIECNAFYVIHHSNYFNNVNDSQLLSIRNKYIEGLGLEDMRSIYFTQYKVNQKDEGE